MVNSSGVAATRSNWPALGKSEPLHERGALRVGGVCHMKTLSAGARAGGGLGGQGYEKSPLRKGSGNKLDLSSDRAGFKALAYN